MALSLTLAAAALAASSAWPALGVSRRVPKRPLTPRIWDQCRQAIRGIHVVEVVANGPQTQHGGTPELAAMRAALVGMFAHNEAGAQRAALLASIGATPLALHSLLQRMQAMSRHHAFMCAFLSCRPGI